MGFDLQVFCLFACLPACIPAYLPAYQPVSLSTCLPTCLAAYMTAGALAANHLPASLPAYLFSYLPACLPTFLSAVWGKHTTSRSQRLSIILNLYEWAGKKHLVSWNLMARTGFKLAIANFTCRQLSRSTRAPALAYKYHISCFQFDIDVLSFLI